MALLKLCRMALLIITALSLIDIGSTSDAKASIKCEHFSLKNIIPQDNVVQFAKKIHNCLELTLDQDVVKRLISLKEKLPSSIRNAVFLKDICIKNKRFNEYLYVPNVGFKYDNERRRLFTWTGSDWDHKKGDFRLIPSGKYFFIVSTNHNEYLFAEYADFVVNSRRRVMTWEPSWKEANVRQALWELIPVDDTGRVYIKNRQYKEYFYAAANDLRYDPERRTVYTWSKDDNGCERDEQCIWEIIAC